MSTVPCSESRFVKHPTFLSVLGLTISLAVWSASLAAPPVVPGTGIKIHEVGDDFEDPNWTFNYNHPKSSRNINKRENSPLGESANRRWLEGPHRGTPDVLERVPTPEDGLPGSNGSLLIRTIKPGIPNQITFKPQQDDIMIKVKTRLGTAIPVSAVPNCTVRVWVPPFEEWENRAGSSFGFRVDCWGAKPGSHEVEQYWPGMFINYQPSKTRNPEQDTAFISIRGDQRGRDIRGPEVFPGWWTMGMSVTPDGMVHFYAREGIENLTAQDHLASYYCYGYRAQRFDLFFFNVVTYDNGKTWSTPWIIDDPEMFTLTPVAAMSNSGRRR